MSVQFLPPRPKSFSIADLIANWFESYEVSIGNWQSEIGNALRDGVTGNTSGFELEDEGSTPSPAANWGAPTRRRFNLRNKAVTSHRTLNKIAKGSSIVTEPDNRSEVTNNGKQVSIQVANRPAAAGN